MREYVFGSYQNFGRVLLIFLIVYLVALLFTFFKALSLCMKASATPSVTVGIGLGENASSGKSDSSGQSSISKELNNAIRITEVVGFFLFILELCFFMLLII